MIKLSILKAAVIPVLISGLLCINHHSTAQTLKKDTVLQPVTDSSKQVDAIDVLGRILHKKEATGNNQAAKRLNFSVVPSAGYSLSTGLAADAVANAAFYTGKRHLENLSSINAELVFDTRQQRIFVNRWEIWSPGNQYKFTSDIRWEKFPTDNYGLGTRTPSANEYDLVYNYVRAYGTFFKKLVTDYYLGIGYNLDYHYNITQDPTETSTRDDFKAYGQTTTSTSSGLVLNFLFDNRKNSINSLNGAYASVIYRQNSTLLNSNTNWRSLLIDIRKYFRPSPTSNNVLAFWSMVWLSSAQTPYLDLPATGQDTYNNSGRGYEQGRFRGRDMLYIEGEYRFGITPNGLFGGVVFANGQTFTNYPDNKFSGFAPATGAGLRVKINKHSNTNVAIDYGVGIKGSRGLFVNLGEVF
ncbi:hypothetical protein HH214_03490 [Mucilaginibacter robiniae]|uniref:Bacterial surface antigen (D15) domain-containing protein n=1 Tax=Mucilaginibacter robiniae TaxID=2728022 RepID=A0A7L5DY97_9SPHI|nr:hypothetical protein [Mucilaginibacter robiniae]QJD95009.1 hypothetical protein HH214_03490 [Mucilaginibacter robiniae]